MSTTYLTAAEFHAVTHGLEDDTPAPRDATPARKRPGPAPSGLPLVKSGNVSLYEADWERAKLLGRGNASAGIRAALTAAFTQGV